LAHRDRSDTLRYGPLSGAEPTRFAIKHDGYRLRLERDGDRVRLIAGGGYNWADCYPRIVEAARKNRVKQFVIDGEVVVLDVDASLNRKHPAVSG
jgi:ATP-dependent DNA ligase